jgi:hypothetical protein
MFTTIKNFKYLGSEISYENEKYVQDKLAKFAQMLRILNNNCKQTLVYKSSRIKVYKVDNALVLPIHL